MRDIIKEFMEDENKFAKDAVLYAKENKGKINDILLKEVENYADILDEREEYIPLSTIYAIYLLAEFEDKRLFKQLVRMYSHKDYDTFNSIGIEIFDKLKHILASVFDGDFELLNSVIENKELDEFDRSSFLELYAYLYKHNRISADDLKKYLLKIIKLYNYEDDHIYNGIVCVIINARLFELLDTVRELFKKDTITLDIIGSYENFIDSIFNYEKDIDGFDKIEDTVKEMSWWSCFDQEEEDKPTSNIDIKNLFKEDKESKSKVGRNDPCPCGSGKKYKKCCLDKDKGLLPYQEYMNENLKEYPKRKTNKEQFDLYDFYKDEYIEADKSLYKVLKHNRVPIHIVRDYAKESEMKLTYLEEAFTKIKEIEEKEKFKTIDAYDKKVSIHYSLNYFLDEYSDLLIDNIDSDNKYLEKLEDLLDFFSNNFDLDQDTKNLIAKKREYLQAN